MGAEFFLFSWKFSFDISFNGSRVFLKLKIFIWFSLWFSLSTGAEFLFFSFNGRWVWSEWWRHLAAMRPPRLPNYFQWKLTLFRLLKNFLSPTKDQIRICQITSNENEHFFVFELFFCLQQKTKLGSAKLLPIKVNTFWSLNSFFVPKLLPIKINTFSSSDYFGVPQQKPN